MKKIALLLLFIIPSLTYCQISKSAKMDQTTLEELKMTVYDKDSSAVAVVLYDQGNLYLYNNNLGEFRTDNYFRIKILKKDGFRKATIKIPFYDKQEIKNIEAITYNLSDGSIKKDKLKEENVVILNKSPKANDIIKEFSLLKKKVTNKDNLLVFYAGHGVYDEGTQVGHWLPSDADMQYELNLISNSQVVDFLKAVPSKHTLLISDACFSGSIFKTRSFEKSPQSIQKKFELTSRKAITSGTLKTVPNKSMFLKYLLDRLENNPNLYLSARQLFDKIEEPVMNNSPNTPQYGTIYGIGDEGGDFIFIKN